LPYDSLSPPPSNKLRNLVSFSQEKQIPIIIGCDSNSHHVIWGSINTNSRGAALIEYLYGSHPKILNRGNVSTFVTRVGQEVIDITLSSADIKREIYNWRVTTEVSLCDHRIIRFKIISDPRKPYEYRNSRSTDWKFFSSKQACSMRGWDKDIVNTCTIDECAAKIQSSIIKAYEKSYSLKTASRVENTPYRSSELGIKVLLIPSHTKAQNSKKRSS
jgi:hypothetical protein